jgi:hypothetical protein
MTEREHRKFNSGLVFGHTISALGTNRMVLH